MKQITHREAMQIAQETLETAECEQAEQQAFVKRSMERMGLEYMEPTSEDEQ